MLQSQSLHLLELGGTENEAHLNPSPKGASAAPCLRSNAGALTLKGAAMLAVSDAVPVKTILKDADLFTVCKEDLAMALRCVFRHRIYCGDSSLLS